MQKSVSQHIKERWGQQSSNEFVTSEQFHPIPAFQNGGTEFITKYAPKWRLYVRAGPKRPLLLCSFKRGIKVSVGRTTLRIPLSLFWAWSS